MAFAARTSGWDSWEGGAPGQGAWGKIWIFPCVGEWIFCKKSMSAMMPRGQRKLRLT